MDRPPGKVIVPRQGSGITRSKSTTSHFFSRGGNVADARLDAQRKLFFLAVIDGQLGAYTDVTFDVSGYKVTRRVPNLVLGLPRAVGRLERRPHLPHGHVVEVERVAAARLRRSLWPGSRSAGCRQLTTRAFFAMGLI